MRRILAYTIFAQIIPTIVDQKGARFKDTLLDLTAEEPKETRFENRLLVLVFSSTSPDPVGEPAGPTPGPRREKDRKRPGEGRHDSVSGSGHDEDRKN